MGKYDPSLMRLFFYFFSYSFSPVFAPVFLEPAMYSTYFQSAIVTGTAQEVTGEAEKIAALRALCRKLTPDRMDGFDAAVSKSLKVTSVWRISMEEVTGKAKLRRPG